MRYRVLLAIGLAGGLAGGTEALGQEQPRVHLARQAERKPTRLPATIRADVGLTLVPVTITDPFGAPVAGLRRETFRLFEDGVEQELRYFNTEDAPVSMGIVFDASSSMEGKLAESREAILRFFDTSRPKDEYFLVEFNDAPKVLTGFTTDPVQIQQAVSRVRPRSMTALVDAVYLAIQEMKTATNSRKLLLVLSDGGDNNSRYTESEMKSFVREGDVCIYTVGIGGGIFGRSTKLLRQLAEETGGQFYRVGNVNDLPEAITLISETIRNQYLLGYVSGNEQHNGLYRKIEVKLNQPADMPHLRASWRSGYYAPAGE